MQLHPDLHQRAVELVHNLPWLASPEPTVQRRMLERDGEEVARATSVVRYLPGAHFPSHEHGAGEEIFVLEGTLGDELGEYPAGTYLRNPTGSEHAPWSTTGCTLFVKLRQLDPADQTRVVVDTHTGTWLPGRAPGIDQLPLAGFGDERTGLVRFAPAAHSTQHQHAGGEEIFVLSGSYADEYGHYPTGTWVRSPHGSIHLPYSEEGCILFIKTGHLPR